MRTLKTGPGKPALRDRRGLAGITGSPTRIGGPETPRSGSTPHGAGQQAQRAKPATRPRPRRPPRSGRVAVADPPANDDLAHAPTAEEATRVEI